MAIDIAYVILSFSISMIILFIIYFTVFPPQEKKDISGITGEQARNESCVLEKNMKYPESSDQSINRLCYLEEVGRKLAE